MAGGRRRIRGLRGHDGLLVVNVKSKVMNRGEVW